MSDFSLNDPTQIEIKKHLIGTEALLSHVATKVSGTKKEAEIYVLPDLGISSNRMRMHGGFFTGVLALWDTSVPIIPVDSTVNSCGVSIFKLKDQITPNEFSEAILKGIGEVERIGYQWNFNVGNHFIVLGELSNGVPCVVFHASAQEFKKGNMREGLYPEKGNWFYDDIRTEVFGDRFLRFISGTKAEKFYETAKRTRVFNQERHRIIAQLLFGTLLRDEIVNIQHYGMPSQNSVAIGCTWDGGVVPLLTAPNKKIYIVEPQKGGNNTIKLDEEYVLFPHGLGVYSKTVGVITYSKTDISVFGNSTEDTLSNNVDVAIRCSDSSEIELENMIDKINNICPATVLDTITPLCTYSKLSRSNSANLKGELLCH